MLSLIQLLKNADRIEPLYAEQSLHAVTSLLLERYSDKNCATTKLRAGLSASDRFLIKSYIHRYLGEKLSLNLLSDLVGLSPFHFARLFRQSFADSPANYITRQRVELAKRLLGGEERLTNIAFTCGFYDQSHFTHHFQKMVGMPPNIYRRTIRKS